MQNTAHTAEHRFTPRTATTGPVACPSRRWSALRRTGTLALAVLALGATGPIVPRPLSQSGATSPDRHFAIPISLLEEHAELYTLFENASRLPGETGAAARRIVRLRTPHVAKEQRIAYPLLRLLPLLSKGEAEPWMAELLPLADQLRAALPALREEHIDIAEAVDMFRLAAGGENHPEYAFVAQRLKHHLRIEEEILFPAALTTAECVRHRLAR